MKKKKNVGYVRCSTDEQSRNGFSIEGQKAELLQMIKKYDIILDHIYEDDGYTASNVNRKQLQQLLKEIKKGNIETLVVVSKDRLIRNTILEKSLDRVFKIYKVELLVLSEGRRFQDISPEDQMAIDIKAVIAEGEIRKISPRTFRGLKGSAELGNYTISRTPFGYKRIPNPKSPGKGTRLEVVPEEAEIVKKIFNMAADRRMSMAEISRYLTKYKVLGIEKWYSQKVKSIISNKIYIGTFETSYFYQENHQPAIIEKDVFERANNMVFDIKRLQKHEYIFSHLIYDMDDGKSLLLNVTGENSKHKTYFYYMDKKMKSYLSEKKVWECFCEAYNQLHSEEKVSKKINAMEKNIQRLNNTKRLYEKKIELEMVSFEKGIAEIIELDKQIEFIYDTIEETRKRNIKTLSDLSRIQKIELVAISIKAILYYRQDEVLVFDFIDNDKIEIKL